MDKKKFLETYIEIETQSFIRADKTKRLNDFLTSIKKTGFNLSLTDTIDCIDFLLQEKIIIRYPLFLNVFYPTLSGGVDNDDINAIKLLIKLLEYYGSYQNLVTEKNVSIWQLIEHGLSTSPDDHELLMLCEKKQRDYFEYTLHEIPSGVLYDANSASIEQCEELLNDLSKYKTVCIKLGINNEELIKDCEFYYSAYKRYLTDLKNYRSFGDYLNNRKRSEVSD